MRRKLGKQAILGKTGGTNPTHIFTLASPFSMGLRGAEQLAILGSNLEWQNVYVVETRPPGRNYP